MRRFSLIFTGFQNQFNLDSMQQFVRLTQWIRQEFIAVSVHGMEIRKRHWKRINPIFEIQWRQEIEYVCNADLTEIRYSPICSLVLFKVSIKLEVSKIQRTCSDLLLQILSKYATILRTSHLLRVEPTTEWEEEIGAGSLNFWDF